MTVTAAPHRAGQGERRLSDQVKMQQEARPVADHVSECFNGGAGEVDHGLLGSSASATALSRERQGHASHTTLVVVVNASWASCCAVVMEGNQVPTVRLPVTSCGRPRWDCEEELSLAGEEVVAYCA